MKQGDEDRDRIEHFDGGSTYFKPAGVVGREELLGEFLAGMKVVGGDGEYLYTVGGDDDPKVKERARLRAELISYYSCPESLVEDAIEYCLADPGRSPAEFVEALIDADGS